MIVGTTVAEDILDWLATNGIGVKGERASIVAGANMFESQMPDQPDICLSIKEGGGLGPEHNIDRAEIALENPGLTVITRSAKPATGLDVYGDAYVRAREIRNVITLIANMAINGVRYLRAQPLGDISELKDDARGRRQFSMTFIVKKVPS